MNDITSDSVVVFNLNTHEFKEFASLNKARWFSSSTIAVKTLYVFGGNNRNHLDTIEALDVSSPSSKWELISSQNFTPRRSAVVCSFSENRILISGG